MSPAWEVVCRAAREGAQQLSGQLGMVRCKLGSQGFPEDGNDELKTAAALAGYPPCHEPAMLWSLDRGCQAHLGNTGRQWNCPRASPSDGNCYGAALLGEKSSAALLQAHRGILVVGVGLGI